MKNKAMKNLILLSVFAVSLFGMNYAVASADIYYNSGYPSGYNTSYTSSSNNTYASYNPVDIRQQVIQNELIAQQRELQLKNQLAEQQYQYDQQQIIREQNLSLQKQNLANVRNNNSNTTSSYVYTQPRVEYIAAQPRTQIQYVPQQQVQQVQYVAQPSTVSYVPTSNQGASVIGSTNKVVYANTGTNSNTGKYVNYDANNQLATAYGYNGYNNGYNNVQVVADPSYDPNSVTALSLNGSGGFLPSSVFQWFMFILLVLAIVIVARIIIKKREIANNAHGFPTH